MVMVEQFAPGQVPLKRWIDLAESIYIDDPLWIAPFHDELEAELSASHGFLNHGRARFFIARHEGRDEARLMAAIDDQCQSAPGGEVIGTVGFFEMISLDAATEIMNEALRWLEKEGATTVWGPMARSIWHGYRFRTRGFHIPPFYGEPYNPPDYPRFFEDYGFEPVKIYRTVQFGPGERAEKRCALDMKLLERLTKRGYSFPKLDLARFDEQLKIIYQILMESYSTFFAFTPLCYDEFANLYGGLRNLVEDGFVILPTDPAGEVVGVFFSIPDHSEAIRTMKGKSNWLARLRFLWNRQRPERIIALFVGMKRRAMGLGLPAGVAGLFHRRSQQAGYPIVFHALMGEGLEDFWQGWQQDARDDDWIEYRLYSYLL
jgi:hypothetical protein